MNQSRKKNDRGQGRKSLNGSQTGESPVLRVRVTQDQLAKVERLGGARWIRNMIDAAKESIKG